MTGLSDASIEHYLRKLAMLRLFPLGHNGRVEVCETFIAEARSGRGVALFVGPRVNRCILS